MRYREKYPRAEIKKIGVVDGKVRELVGNSICCPQIEFSTSSDGVYGDTQTVNGWIIKIDGTAYAIDPCGEGKYFSIGGGQEGLYTLLRIANQYSSLAEARKKEHWPF